MEHPPAYKPLDDRDTPLHRPAEEAVRFPDDDEKSWGIRDVLCAVAYALLIVALVLNADVFLARLGVGVRVRVLYEDDRGIGGRVLVQGVGEMAEVSCSFSGSKGFEAANSGHCRCTSAAKARQATRRACSHCCGMRSRRKNKASARGIL
jgi:hypothetical protein